MDPEKRNVIEELDRITASDDFRSKPVMKKLLEYLVTESVEGRSDQIKGYSIGLDVFGQGSSFDPNRSALVRNNAVRLRALLKTYYLGEGRNNPLHIEIPKGKYAPQFSVSQDEAKSVPVGEGVSARSSQESQEVLPPAIGVLPFSNQTSNSGLEYLASGFSRELADALTKFDFRVISLDRSTSPEEKGVAFSIDGEVAAFGSQVKIYFRLINVTDNSQLWADSVKFNTEHDDLFSVQENITGRIASLIGGEYGHVNQHRYQVMLESRPQSLTEQDILLKHYHYVTILDAELLPRHLEEVLRAYERHPESALLAALASGFYLNTWTFSGTDDDAALQECARLAEKAYALSPNHQVVVSHLASKCFHFDERERFFSLFERSREWMANSPMRLGTWAMYISLFGEWERGKALMDQVFDRNTNFPFWLHGITCAYFLKLRDHDSALSEANKYQIPGLFWGPAYRASILAHLGRLEEAQSEFDTLLEWRPDFLECGRLLMGRFIIEPDMLEHIFEGFAKIGEKLA